VDASFRCVPRPQPVTAGSFKRIGTGKRRLDPIKIAKALGPASPQILQAAATEEDLSVVIQFVHMDGQGEEHVYQTLTLSGAVVQNVKRTAPPGGTRGSGAKLFEEVTLDPGEQDLTHKHVANHRWDLLSNDRRRAQRR
jgi:type VI secretion system Hcp family effector